MIFRLDEGNIEIILFLRLSISGVRSADIADLLLKEAHIVVTDGEGFGADGFLRLSYATSMENLHRAVDKMKTIFGAGSTVTA